jgi:hypothetical protein
MSEAEKLPPGSFFDAIREWGELVAKNRAKFLEENGYELPDGRVPVSAASAASAAFAKAYQEALKELDETAWDSDNKLCESP